VEDRIYTSDIVITTRDLFAMEIRVKYQDDILIFFPSGRLDGSGAILLQQSLMTNLTDSVNHVIMDLSDVPYVSSAGIRIFLIARNLVKDRHGHVVLCNVGEFPKNVLTMAGMDRVFPIVENQIQAISAVHEMRSNVPGKKVSHSSPEILKNGPLIFSSGEEKPAILEVSGSLTRVLHSGISSDDVSKLHFADCEYSLGLGALAENREQARSLLGEMITLHGSIVWLPTDGNGTPDFFIPIKQTGDVYIYSGFAAALKGPFHEYFSLNLDVSHTISLNEIYEMIFAHARNTRPDYQGIIAVALIGESRGIRSSGIRHSPIVENAPQDGGSIMDSGNIDEWIEMKEGFQYDGETVVTFGIGIDLRHDLSSFNPDDLKSLYYIHPANRESQKMYLHNHGVIFRNLPIQWEHDISREIKRILITGDFLDMRHLMDDSRMQSVRGAIAYISDIRIEN
jgi:anti-anti-sigma factor